MKLVENVSAEGMGSSRSCLILATSY